MAQAKPEATTEMPDRFDIGSAGTAIESLIPDDGEIEGQAQAEEISQESDDDLLEDVEAEAEEVEAEDDDSDESDDDELLEDDEPEENSEDNPKFKVKVDGEEIEVDLNELKNGYSRTKVFTKKTQELAQLRKEAEAEFEAVRAEREKYAQALNTFAQQFQEDEQVDWDKLRAEDPLEYSIKMADYQRKQQQKQMIMQEQQQLMQLQQQDQMRQMQEVLQSEQQKLTEAIPAWKDPARAKTEKKLITEQGKKLGFSEEELKQVFDHRAVVALRKAALYDQIMAKKSAVKPQAEKTLKAGSANKKRITQAQKAQRRAASSGKVQDAAAALSFLLD